METNCFILTFRRWKIATLASTWSREQNGEKTNHETTNNKFSHDLTTNKLRVHNIIYTFVVWLYYLYAFNSIVKYCIVVCVTATAEIWKHPSDVTANVRASRMLTPLAIKAINIQIKHKQTLPTQYSYWNFLHIRFLNI